MKVYNPTASGQNVTFKYNAQNFTLKPDNLMEVDDDYGKSLQEKYPFLRNLDNPLYLPYNHTYELSKPAKRLSDRLREFGLNAYRSLCGKLGYRING